MNDQVAQDARRSLALLGAFTGVTALVVVLVAVVAGASLVVAVVLAVVVAGGAGALAWWRSEAVVLRLGRAVPADPTEHARYHNLVESLCAGIGLPKPRLHVIDDAALNAFAVGRDAKHGAVAVTTGLLAGLERVELEAVLAHELSRIRHADIALDTLAVTTVGVPTLLADACIRLRWWDGGRRLPDGPRPGKVPFLGAVGTALVRLSPLAGLLRATVPAGRVAGADLAAVGMTRYPPGLVAALERVEAVGAVSHAGARATAHLWLACPVAVTDDEGELARWNRRFDVHPPMAERIATLREL